MAFKLAGTGIDYFEGTKLYYSTGSIKNNIFTPEGEYNYHNRPSRANRLAQKGEIIDAKMQGTLKVEIIDERLEGSLLSTGFYVLQPYINNYQYTKLVIMSDYYQRSKDLKCSGTTQKAITDSELSTILIPLPPLKEQQKIVEKTNIIGILIQEYDKYEKQLTELESTFAEKLKKSILQYAIEGKLVKQEPNDEPASVLLERIKAEKEKLIKEGKIKRDKNESYIYQGDDKNYYGNIPISWRLVPLKAICLVKGGKRIPAGENFSIEPTNYKYLRVKDMKQHTIISCAYINQNIFEIIKNYRIYENEIYITVAGTIGYVGTVPKEYSGANLTENADKLILSKNIDKKWFIHYLCSEVCQKQIRACTTQVGQPKLAIKRIEELFILLPPIREQMRINSKITNLLNYLKL